MEIYKKKAAKSTDAVELVGINDDIDSLDLDVAIIKKVNGLPTSHKRFQWYGNIYKSQQLAKGVFSKDLMEGAVLPFIIDSAKKWLQKNVFSPWRLLKVIDG